MVAAERLPPGPDRIQGVALGLGAAGPLGPIDLGHPLALIEQEARQPGAIAAGPLKRPAAAARCPLASEAQQLLVALLAARDLHLGDQPTGGVQHGRGVAVAMGVDPDDMLDPAL